jgi:hypothetical protein
VKKEVSVEIGGGRGAGELLGGAIMEVLEYNSSSFGKRDRDYEVQVAARVGIENARRLLQILSHQQRTSCSSSSSQVQCGVGKDDESWRGESDAAIAGVAVSKFQKVVSLLQSRTGHARFRRAPPQINRNKAGSYEYVFFESANFAQEDELIKRKDDSKTDRAETSRPEVFNKEFTPDRAEASRPEVFNKKFKPDKAETSRREVFNFVADQLPVSDRSNGANVIPTSLNDTQQIQQQQQQQQQHLQLQQQQQQQQLQIQQQVQQLLWQHQQLQGVTPFGYFPVLQVLPLETVSPRKKKQEEEEEEEEQQQQLEGGDSMGKPNAEKTNRNCDNNSMSSGPVPLSTTTKSTFSKSFSQSFSQSFSKSFSVVSVDGSAAATDSNLQQQTSSLPPTRPLPQGSRDHTTGGCKKKSCSGKASDENKAGGKSCSSLHGRCHCSKRR